jgi:Uma2 family endonuclease
MAAHPRPHLSLDAYTEIETSTGLKHEYYRGSVYAMTGASPRHNLTVANVIALLHTQLRGRACTVYPSDLRIKVEQTGLYTYPDISVICGELRLDSAKRDTATNPTVLVEVLSPSTRDYDRGTKFQHYRAIDTLREYIVISQDAPHIEQYIRQDSDQWLLREFELPEQIVALDSIGCTIDLQGVYEKVVFPSSGTDQPDSELHPPA